jgi:transposase
MRRHELSDSQWALIQEFMPVSDGPGRPWRDHRSMVNAMLWILHTGAPWRDLPEYYGPWQSVFD